MTDLKLPEGWSPVSWSDKGALAAQFRKELAPGHPLQRAVYSVIATHDSEDSVVVDAPTLSPRFYLMHLSWNKSAEHRAPHAMDNLDELADIFGPASDDIDDISLWTDSASHRGLLFVQHLVDGSEILDPLFWPKNKPLPASTDELPALGWEHITGPLYPSARVDGDLVPTGQKVEYWVRPVIDDFFLLRAISTPGEPITIKQLIPQDPRLIEVETEAELEQQLPAGFYCRATSPMSPRYGLAGFPKKAG